MDTRHWFPATTVQQIVVERSVDLLQLEFSFSSFSLGSPMSGHDAFRARLCPIFLMSDPEESCISTTPTCEDAAAEWCNPMVERKRCRKRRISTDDFRDLSPGRCAPAAPSVKKNKNAREAQHFTFTRTKHTESRREVVHQEAGTGDDSRGFSAGLFGGLHRQEQQTVMQRS